MNARRVRRNLAKIDVGRLRSLRLRNALLADRLERRLGRRLSEAEFQSLVAAQAPDPLSLRQTCHRCQDLRFVVHHSPSGSRWLTHVPR